MRYRLPDGRQVQKKLGPAWTERGRPPAGYFTKRTAEDALRAVLDEARRGVLPGLVRTGATFADAAAEFLRYAEHDRGCKPSTLRDYLAGLVARSYEHPNEHPTAVSEAGRAVRVQPDSRNREPGRTSRARARCIDCRRPVW
jgi:hypothetical protein